MGIVLRTSRCWYYSRLAVLPRPGPGDRRSTARCIRLRSGLNNAAAASVEAAATGACSRARHQRACRDTHAKGHYDGAGQPFQLEVPGRPLTIRQ